MDFLRPIQMGGMGSGNAEWIAHCFRWPEHRARAACDALINQGRLVIWPDGSLRPNPRRQFDG